MTRPARFLSLRLSLAAAMAWWALGSQPATAQPADLIVTNAKIATLDAASTQVEALAARDGKIVALGSFAAIRNWAGPATRIVDGGGRRVIPGLIDSHIHAIRAALSYATEVNWIGADTIGEAMARIHQAAGQGRPGRWLIVAGGWTEQQFAERRRPNEAELAAAAPDNPVYPALLFGRVDDAEGHGHPEHLARGPAARPFLGGRRGRSQDGVDIRQHRQHFGPV